MSDLFNHYYDINVIFSSIRNSVQKIVPLQFLENNTLLYLKEQREDKYLHSEKLNLFIEIII